MDFKKKQKITSDLYEEFKAKRGNKPKDEYFDYEYACFLQNKIVELKECEGNPCKLKKGKCNKHGVNAPLLWKDVLDEFYVEHDKQISNGDYKNRMILVFRDWLEKNYKVPERNGR